MTPTEISPIMQAEFRIAKHLRKVLHLDCENEMNQWISVKENPPQVSYLESNNEDDPYECYPVLVFSPERPGIFCVASLVKEQDENDWNYEELSWELYIPGNGGNIEEVDFDVFTHWMPLPEPPKVEDE